MTMLYEMCACTDPGRVRNHNEDSVAFDAAVGLGVLADGLGGYSAGEVASEMATGTILAEMRRWLREAAAQPGGDAVRRVLRDCVAQANRQVLAAADADPRYRGMASTLVAAVFLGRRLVLGHVGDSRCYRWRRGALIQLTKDHSYVQEQVDAGHLTPAQAAVSGRRNLVTRALGVAQEVQLELHEHDVEPGDLYLLCSDGLTDMVSEAEMTRLLDLPAGLAQRAQALVDAANARGGHDNISVLLVHAEAGCRTMS